jgi:hypothetical protein
MARSAKFLFSGCVALLCVQADAAQSGPGEQPPVLAQELETVRASGKVMTALWTRRSDSYTLQLVFPIPGTARPGAARRESASPAAGIQASLARVKIWLLNADGSQSLPTYRSAPPKLEQVSCMRCISYEVSYSFPLQLGENAVAAAVQINDEFFIDPLQRWDNRKTQP